MSTEIPMSYKRYRVLWIIIHAVVLVALLLLVVHWFCDGGGDQTLAHWGRRVMRLQHDLATAVPFPWDTF